MTAESDMFNSDPTFVAVVTPAAGYSAGEVIQLPSGRAGALRGQIAKTVGQAAAFTVRGKVTLLKTASVVILKGAPLYWDRSANTVTPLKALAGADFFIGSAVADATAAATTVVVDMNVEPVYLIDIMRDPTDTVLVGAATVTMQPGYSTLKIIATNEAEKCDVMSQHSVPVTVPFIIEGRVASYEIGSDNTVDFNIGLANDTHATSADTITESAFLHLDEVLSIYAESDDGSTEVAASDTLVDCVDDTYFDFAFDCRDLTDIHVYINGVEVLAATAFDISAATGPLKLLAHIEKTTGTATGEARVSKLALRTTDLAV